jgi:hypothetical protein
VHQRDRLALLGMESKPAADISQDDGPGDQVLGAKEGPNAALEQSVRHLDQQDDHRIEELEQQGEAHPDGEPGPQR